MLLALDWILGASGGFAAVITPRAHLRNMLGGAAPLGMSGRASSASLVIIAVLCAFFAVRRAQRTR